MGGVPCQSSVPRKGERWLRPASPVWDILFKEHLSLELRSRRLGTDRVVVSTGQPSQVPWVLPLCRPFWSPCRSSPSRSAGRSCRAGSCCRRTTSSTSRTGSTGSRGCVGRWRSFSHLTCPPTWDKTMKGCKHLQYQRSPASRKPIKIFTTPPRSSRCPRLCWSNTTSGSPSTG